MRQTRSALGSKTALSLRRPEPGTVQIRNKKKARGERNLPKIDSNQDRAEQGRAGQGRAGQGRAGARAGAKLQLDLLAFPFLAVVAGCKSRVAAE